MHLRGKSWGSFLFRFVSISISISVRIFICCLSSAGVSPLYKVATPSCLKSLRWIVPLFARAPPCLLAPIEALYVRMCGTTFWVFTRPTLLNNKKIGHPFSHVRAYPTHVPRRPCFQVFFLRVLVLYIDLYIDLCIDLYIDHHHTGSHLFPSSTDLSMLRPIERTLPWMPLT